MMDEILQELKNINIRLDENNQRLFHLEEQVYAQAEKVEKHERELMNLHEYIKSIQVQADVDLEQGIANENVLDDEPLQCSSIDIQQNAEDADGKRETNGKVLESKLRF